MQNNVGGSARITTTFMQRFVHLSSLPARVNFLMMTQFETQRQFLKLQHAACKFLGKYNRGRNNLRWRGKFLHFFISVSPIKCPICYNYHNIYPTFLMKPSVEIMKGNHDIVLEIIAPSLVVQKGRGQFSWRDGQRIT